MARPSTLTIDQSWTHLRISYCEDTTPTNDCPEYYAGDALNPSSISCGTLHPGPPPYYHYSNYKTIAEKDGSYWKLMNNGETYSVINGGQIKTNGKTGVTLNFDSSGGKDIRDLIFAKRWSEKWCLCGGHDQLYTMTVPRPSLPAL